MSGHKEIEKKLAKSILNLVNNAMMKAMDTIDTHEGRYMKRELKLAEALEEPVFTQKRKYTHSAKFLRKQLRKSKRK